MEREKMKSEIVTLAKKLIRFESTKENTDVLHQVIGFCEAWFLESENRDRFVVRTFEKHEKPSLVVTFGKTKTPDIFMVGHLDVVEGGEEMFEPRTEEEKLLGRGANDMKGVDAVMMVLMKELSKLENPPNAGLMLTSDEEGGGFDGVNYLLKEEEFSCKCAFVPDGGKDFDVIIGQKGVFHFKVRAAGKAGHGSRPWKGENAIDKLIRVYQRLRQEFPNPKTRDDWKPSLNLGKIKGGDAVNKVADWAEMDLDLRYTEKDRIEEIKKKIREVITGFEEVEFEERVSGNVFSVPEDSHFVKKWREIEKKVLGQEGETGKECGASDARFFSEKGIPVVVSKPVGGDSHGDDEFLDIDSLPHYFEILWRFVNEIA